jgi:hypothetical protein
LNPNGDAPPPSDVTFRGMSKLMVIAPASEPAGFSSLTPTSEPWMRVDVIEEIVSVPSKRTSSSCDVHACRREAVELEIAAQ